ncbi:hypothetical protein C8J57DRAFT_1267698 [Mycena rebaudengoi]|nr:hypothetical protein C8J57DRAFT_1267698 [Mycena rebaudengoi]
MFSASQIAALIVITSGMAPVFSAPVPTVQPELEARLSFGGLSGIFKKLGTGILSGGAIEGLGKLLGLGDDNAEDSAAAATTDAAEATDPSTSIVRRDSVMSDEELNDLLEWFNDNIPAPLEARSPLKVPSGLATGIAGIGGSILGSSAVGGLFDKLKELFSREVSLDELD